MALACIAFSLTFVAVSVRHYQAAQLAESADPRAIHAALRLEPGNAATWEKRARTQLFADQNAPAAIGNLEEATRLDPHRASAWLLLATAAQVNGDATLVKQAIMSAVAADPTSPTVAWEAGNAFLSLGDNDAALREFRVVLSAGTLTPETLQLCWRVLHDADRIARDLLEPRPSDHLALLKVVMDAREKDAALTVWNRLMQLGRSFPAAGALPFIQFLLDQHEPQRAAAAWKQLASADPALTTYVPKPDNLLVNSGFDEDILGGGFDWRILASHKITVEVDTTEFHGGSRSLAFTFDNATDTDAGLRQFVLVEPNTRYQFGAFVRTRELLSANPPRFIINDAYSHAQLLATEEFETSMPWRQVGGTFTTGADTRLIVIRLSREGNIQSLQRGRLWIDDARLVRQ